MSSTSRLPHDIDWSLLSEDARRTVREIALPLSQGAERPEIADGLGITARELGKRMGDLRKELLAQVDVLTERVERWRDEA